MQQVRPDASIKVFIAHSGNDSRIAKCLIDLLTKAMHLTSDQIRCTSVDGYRLPAGVQIDETLRVEVHDSELFIGIITPNSIKSAYVIFEIGARWGAQYPMIPVLAAGATPEYLQGPLAGINALHAGEEGQVHQLVEEAASHLKRTHDKPSSYQAEVKELVRLSRELWDSTDEPSNTDEPLKLSEDAQELIAEAAKDNGHLIVVVTTDAGGAVLINRKQFGETKERRSQARWSAAIGELRNHQLVEPYNGSGEAYEVTYKGFQVADALAED